MTVKIEIAKSFRMEKFQCHSLGTRDSRKNFGYWHSFEAIRCHHFWLWSTNNKFSVDNFYNQKSLTMPNANAKFFVRPAGMRIQFKFQIKCSWLKVCRKYAHTVWIKRNDVKTLSKSIGGEKLKNFQSNYFAAKCLLKSSQLKHFVEASYWTTREARDERDGSWTLNIQIEASRNKI